MQCLESHALELRSYEIVFWPGFETFVEKDEDDVSTDPILHAAKHADIDLSKFNFVTYRNNLNKVETAFWETPNAMLVALLCVASVPFLCRSPERPPPRGAGPFLPCIASSLSMSTQVAGAQQGECGLLFDGQRAAWVRHGC